MISPSSAAGKFWTTCAAVCWRRLCSLLFVAGWLWLPGSPLVWTLAGALTLAVPVLTGLVLGVVQAVSGSPWRQVFRAFQTGLVRWVLALAFILYETLLTLGGIATTLVRLFVTRKHLLQWTSYADTVRVLAGGVTLNQILAAILSTGALAGVDHLDRSRPRCVRRCRS